VTERPAPAATEAVALDEPAPTPPPDELVQIRNLSVQFKTRKGMVSRTTVLITAVDDVTLSIERGRTLGVVGATGSGKSTIAHVVMGMVKPTAGTVHVAGRDITKLSGAERLAHQRLVQVVLQDPYSSLNPRMKVGDIIAEPLTVGQADGQKTGGKARAARVAELLDLVGLPRNRAERFPHQFSGGQRQRIAIARALAPRPQLIVLDEPTSALDVSVRAQILSLLKSLQVELGVTYLVISHDLVTVAFLASDVAVMHLGRIVESGPSRALYKSPRHPYTLELLASAPGASGEFLLQPRPSLPSPAALPPEACRYAYRCALRTRLGDPERCLEQDPPLLPVSLRHSAACHFTNEVAVVAEQADLAGDR
jgi:oligopeptide/dipeptide ABC transporter ATP-binding protein